MTTQRNKINTLENRIDTLENYILNLEDQVKFLKHIVSTQNDTIKILASTKDRETQSTKNNEMNQVSQVSQVSQVPQTAVIEHSDSTKNQDNKSDITVSQSYERNSIANPISLTRRRLII